MAWTGRNLLPRLRDYGVAPEDIDIVIDTHLHFDHCGGNTRARERQSRCRRFPTRNISCKKANTSTRCIPPNATAPAISREITCRSSRAASSRLLEGDQQIVPGVEVVRVPGHTADMQCVKLTGGGKTAFLLADLVPTTAHLPLPWIMGYDLYPMTTLENKKKWLPEVAREGWLALFAHDPRVPAAYLRERDGQMRSWNR